MSARNLIATYFAELTDCADWTEDLFLDDLHVLLDVGEDGWLDKEALVTLSVSTNLDSGARLLTLLDVAISRSVMRASQAQAHSLHDAVKLYLRYYDKVRIELVALIAKQHTLWSLEGILCEWVTNNVLLCTLLESLDELVVDAFLDEDS